MIPSVQKLRIGWKSGNDDSRFLELTNTRDSCLQNRSGKQTTNATKQPSGKFPEQRNENSVTEFIGTRPVRVILGAKVIPVQRSAPLGCRFDRIRMDAVRPRCRQAVVVLPR